MDKKPTIIVKYKIDDYSTYSDEELFEKAEMYIGKLMILEHSKKVPGKVKKWFSAYLNIYNIIKTLQERGDIKDSEIWKDLNISLN